MATTVEYVQNKEPFTAWTDGIPRTIRHGEIIPTDDPIYKGREHLFETLDEHAAREIQQRQGMGIMPGTAPVERATAAPGERREVRIPQPDDVPKAVPGYPCDHEGCEFASTTERGLKIHQHTHNDDK